MFADQRSCWLETKAQVTGLWSCPPGRALSSLCLCFEGDYLSFRCARPEPRLTRKSREPRSPVQYGMAKYMGFRGEPVHTHRDNRCPAETLPRGSTPIAHSSTRVPCCRRAVNAELLSALELPFDLHLFLLSRPSLDGKHAEHTLASVAAAHRGAPQWANWPSRISDGPRGARARSKLSSRQCGRLERWGEVGAGVGSSAVLLCRCSVVSYAQRSRLHSGSFEGVYERQVETFGNPN